MANQTIRAFLSALTILFVLQHSGAHADQGYIFKQISLNEGLSQSTVRCMLNDSKGFIWIGTKSGLNRFDRYSLKTYGYKKNDRNTIPGNQISFILEDRSGTIWVGTENGLARYDAGSDTFRPVAYRNRPLLARSAIELRGGVLFGGEGRLYLYANADGKLREVARTGSPSPEAFTSIRRWHGQTLVLATRRDGVWTFDTRSQKLSRVRFIDEQDIMTLYVDRQQQVWIAPYGQGIKAYDLQGRERAHYHSRNSRLSNDVVLDLIEVKQQFWIATDGGGINVFDPRTKTFTALKHIPGNAASLPENSILSLYHDREDNLWAGSVRGGLISIRKAFIHTYKDAPLNGIYGLSEKTVLSTYEDRSGTLWVGTDGGGINRFDAGSGTIRHFLSSYGLKIASLTDFDGRNLLISAFSKGLYLFNKNTGAVTPFHPETIGAEGAAIRSAGIAINVNKVNDRDLYLFTDKIYHYSLVTKKFSPVQFDSRLNVYGSLLKIHSTGQHTWFFSPFGIFELRHADNRVRTILTLPNADNPITAVARDRRGTLWLGNRDGLHYFDAKNKVIRAVRTSLFTEISALTADSAGRLWIGAQNLVYLYMPRQHKFVAFGESDGVIPNEFLFKPSLITASGDIYLGGVKGLLHISKDIPAITPDHPVISLMGLDLNGVPWLNRLKPGANAVTIPWNHSSLSIKIMAREKDVFRKKMFRYQISGLDRQVLETYDHQLAIGSLPAGTYRILVSCSLKNGGWSKYAEVLAINVNPPWFRSLWFLALVSAVVTVAIVIFYRMAIAKRERKLRWDMKEHEQKSYEAKIRFLIHISHELRTPLTLIYSPLRRMLGKGDLEQDLERKLQAIYRQAGKMKEIIDMVLDVRKIELGQEKLQLGRTHLNTWLAAIADNFSTEFEDKGIQLVLKPDPAVGELAFDLKKCELVLTNLLANALKFSPAGGTIIISSQLQGDRVRVSVADEGIGLDHLEENQLFKPFYQGMHGKDGSGIGLSFSKILVELHGGRIGALPNPVRGATFFFELPTGLASDENVVAEAPGLSTEPAVPAGDQRSATGFDTSAYSVLVVEDQPELRSFLAESLKPNFQTVMEAEDGLQAVSLLERQQPDLIISDVMMPGMDGFALCRHIKENINISHIPVLLLTTQGDAESRNLGYKLGADAYVAKPFELDFLQTLLESLLRNREAVKSKYKATGLFPAPQEGTFSSADEAFMRKLNELILNNLDNEKLDVEFLTDKMAMSRATLYAKLKNIADIGVNDYINKFRLEKAAYLLTHSDKSIMDIADAVGFSNQRYFSTVFKQAYQTTPTLYRQQHARKDK